jgi:hypothetical protein
LLVDIVRLLLRLVMHKFWVVKSYNHPTYAKINVQLNLLLKLTGDEK